MPANPHRGQAPLIVGGEEITLRFTWNAMAALIGRFGEEWDKALNEALDIVDCGAVADFLSILSERPASFFMENSPPWIPVKESIITAYNLFMFGVPTIEETQTEAGERSSEDGPLPRGESWNGFGRRLLRRVWSRASSGRQHSTKPLSGSGQAARA